MANLLNDAEIESIQRPTTPMHHHKIRHYKQRVPHAICANLHCLSRMACAQRASLLPMMPRVMLHKHHISPNTVAAMSSLCQLIVPRAFSLSAMSLPH